MQILLRKATLADLPHILAIMNHAITHTTANYDYEPHTFEAQKEWFDQKQAENMPIIVAEYEQACIAFGTYGSFRAKEGYKFTVEHSIYVAEPYRGKGMGKLLLGELIALARGQGFHALIAGIDAENKGSIAFHQQFGFEEVGRLREVGFKFDRWLDVLFMEKLL